jgi:hypothetical protein
MQAKLDELKGKYHELDVRFLAAEFELNDASPAFRGYFSNY